MTEQLKGANGNDNRSGSTNCKVVILVCVVFAMLGVAGGLMVAERRHEAQRSSEEIARLKLVQDRLKAEVEKAKADAEKAKAEAKIARTRLKEEEEAKS